MTTGTSVPAFACPISLCRWPRLPWWNFRAARVGNPSALYWLLGSYIPFPRTLDDRKLTLDPRRSVAERYRGREDYLQRIRAAAADLVKGGFLLERDVPGVLERADRHWSHLTQPTQSDQDGPSK
jgi:hypothetical protein